MFKNIIAPIQAWLVSQGRCVGCGALLKNAKTEKHTSDTSKITCSCGRIFIYHHKNNTYRRALFEEI